MQITNNNLLSELQKFFTQERSQEILLDLDNTKQNFNLQLTIEELWEQEKLYYIFHGLSSFDLGYFQSQKSFGCSQHQIFKAFYKIKSCIESCIHEEHLESCKTTIQLFLEQFNNIVACDMLVEELTYHLNCKIISLPKK